jgi:Protein of unknown function (DUF1353)
MKSSKVPLLLLMITLVGCPGPKTQEIPPSPLTVAFADEVHSVIFRPLEYRIGETGTVIRVPEGFVTDYASIPRAFWQFLPVHGRYGRAAIVHDYLYWTQHCTRKQADNILLIAMIESGVAPKKRVEIYRGVRLGGDRAWKNNAQERKSGKPRVIPEEFLMADEFLQLAGEETWPEYQSRLIKAGVHDEADPEDNSAEYCKLGNIKAPPVTPEPDQGSEASH